MDIVERISSNFSAPNLSCADRLYLIQNDDRDSMTVTR
jgi:hypothetical protein